MNDQENRYRRGVALVKLLSGRWTVPMLSELAQSPSGRRYQELQDFLEAISHKVLTDTLRRAERDGLTCRYLDPGRVETATLYQITELGRSLHGPLSALDQWVAVNWNHVEAARRDWSNRSKP